MSKILSMVSILILVASCLIIVGNNYASATKPSVPEFTVRYIDYSYDIPPVYGTDQYTGKTIIVKDGEHIDNRTIEFKIKNQPFTPYNDSSGNYIGLYYNFRYKGHYGTEWSYYPFSPDGQSVIPYNGYSWGTGDLSPKLSASNSEYTVISLVLAVLHVPAGNEAEFQVQALTGHIDSEHSGLLAGSFFDFIGESSDWSSTKTITIGDSASTVTQLPTVFPSQSTSTPTESPLENTSLSPTVTSSQPIAGILLFGLDWVGIIVVALLAMVVVLLVCVVVFLRRRR